MIIKVFKRWKKKINKKKNKKNPQLNKDINWKSLNVFDYLKSLRQKTEDLINEIKDADDDIDKYKIVFIGSNREKFNFNIFRMPLNFLLAIYNDEISLKEAEFREIREI